MNDKQTPHVKAFCYQLRDCITSLIAVHRPDHSADQTTVDG